MNVLKGSLIVAILAASVALSQTAGAEGLLSRVMAPSPAQPPVPPPPAPGMMQNQNPAPNATMLPEGGPVRAPMVPGMNAGINNGMSNPLLANLMNNNANCHRENIQFTTQHSFSNTDLVALTQAYSKEKQQVLQAASKVGATLTVVSENYNVNSADTNYSLRHSGLFVLSGTVNYRMKPAAKAADLYKALNNATIQTRMNYSMNDNCTRE